MVYHGQRNGLLISYLYFLFIHLILPFLTQVITYSVLVCAQLCVCLPVCVRDNFKSYKLVFLKFSFQNNPEISDPPPVCTLMNALCCHLYIFIELETDKELIIPKRKVQLTRVFQTKHRSIFKLQQFHYENNINIFKIILKIIKRSILYLNRFPINRFTVYKVIWRFLKILSNVDEVAC